MTTAILSAGWPRHWDAAVRYLEQSGCPPGTLILPAQVAARWQAAPGRPGLDGAPGSPGPDAPPTVIALPAEELRSGRLSRRSTATLRGAHVQRLLVFRGDGGELSVEAAQRIAVAGLVRELLVQHSLDAPPLRFGRLALLRATARSLLRRQAPAAAKPRPMELFDPIAGRQLPAGRGFSGVDARGSLSITPLGYLEIPGMTHPGNLEPSPHRRLIMLGGSTLYGLGLPDNSATIPAGVHRALQASGDRWEVLSFGVPGGWARGESAALLYRLRYARPDVVVSLSGWNDFNTLFAGELVHGPGAEVLNWTFSDYHHYLRIHAPEEISETATAFADKDRVRQTLAQLDSRVFPRSGAELREKVWLDNQALMALVCAEAGIRFICALQPHSLLQPALPIDFTRDWVQSHYDFAFARHYAGGGSLFDAYRTRIGDVYGTYRRGLETLTARYPAARFADLSTAFHQDETPCFLDGVHLTAHGAARLASLIAALVPERGGNGAELATASEHG